MECSLSLALKEPTFKSKGEKKKNSKSYTNSKG